MHSTNGIRKTAFSSVIPLAGLLLAGLLGGAGVQAGQVDLTPPPGSVAFGTSVTALTNGNFVVTDPKWTDGVNASLGAVYLYHGATLTNIMRIVGSHANDQVGSGEIQVITNGNFLILSRYWANGSATNAGAVTWCSASTGPIGNVGFSNVVSSANSLVGAYANDSIGYDSQYSYRLQIYILSNGNYVIHSPGWNSFLGASTWGSGSTGVVGVVSSSNSRVGRVANDFSGGEINALPNGNYCISLVNYDDQQKDQGATSWCSGTAPSTGQINSGNSLMAGYGYPGFLQLPNGNYVVCSYAKNVGGNTASGAATWVNGSTGLPTGYPNSGNSLVGPSYAQVGVRIYLLANGNYVVGSCFDNNWVGAVTWCNKDGSTVGYVTSGNSVYGAVSSDWVVPPVTCLSNGNFVVMNGTAYYPGSGVGCGAVGMAVLLSGSGPSSGYFYNQNHIRGKYSGDFYGGALVQPMPNGSFILFTYAYRGTSDTTGPIPGAATFCNGNAGALPNQPISSSYSMIGTIWTRDGSQTGDLGLGINYGGDNFIVLPNGYYVLKLFNYNNGAGGYLMRSAASGALTGYTTSYTVLSGQVKGDFDNASLCPLPNGNYVISAPNYTVGGNAQAGAVAWCNGTTGRSGALTAANSLVGSSAYDWIGSSGTPYWLSAVSALPNSDYVVVSRAWHNGSVSNAGAVTWCNGVTGTTGYISATNSIVGSSAGDVVGVVGGDNRYNPRVSVLTNLLGTNALVVGSPSWNNGSLSQAGAVTVATNRATAFGAVSVTNSLVGDQVSEQVGYSTVTYFGNGYGALSTPYRDNGILADAGAISLLNLTNMAGTVSVSNSVLGTAPG